MNTRQSVVGTFGFWLTVPAGISLLIGWLLHEFVSEKLSIYGMAALAYAIFTLIAASRNQSGFIRGILILMNLAVVLAFGYFQWHATWPTSSAWIGLSIAGAAWFGIMVSLLYRLGRRAQEPEGDHSTHGNSSHDGNMDVNVTEKIIAALKLTSQKGDVTVDAGQLIKNLGLQGLANNREAIAHMIENINASLDRGRIPAKYVRAAEQTIVNLLNLEEEQVESDKTDPWSNADKYKDEPIDDRRATF